jgi:IclR family transcriptional regulator, KDG regulon repressor
MHRIIANVQNRKRDIYYIEVLGKTLDILDVFGHSDRRRLSLQEISVVTKLSKNTVFRILYTLAEHGYILKENHSYGLGPKFGDLSDVRLHRLDLLSVASPHLDALRDQFGETVNLGVLDNGSIRYVDVRESRARIRLAERVGGSDPLHSTALGKAHLAYLPPDEVRTLMKQAGMPKHTRRTLTTLSGLTAELETVRRLGYAVDREESMLGAFCVAVPVLNSQRLPVAAISISGPTIRFDESKLPSASQALLKSAKEIQKKLGHP